MLKSSYFTYSFIGILLFSVMGCATTKFIFDKEGLTTEEFNRDKYECVKESQTSWSGGGTGTLGLAMIFSSKSSAEKQANAMFKMCMEARGYTAREVSNNEYGHNKTYGDLMKPFSKMSQNLCKNEEYNILFIKSACLSKDITYEQLSDKNMITDDEKKIYLKYRDEQSAIRKKMCDSLQASEDPRMKEILIYSKKAHDDSDKVAVNLINGKISWGEFNKFRKEHAKEIQKEMTRFFRDN